MFDVRDRDDDAFARGPKNRASRRCEEAWRLDYGISSSGFKTRGKVGYMGSGFMSSVDESIEAAN